MDQSPEFVSPNIPKGDEKVVFEHSELILDYFYLGHLPFEKQAKYKFKQDGRPKTDVEAILASNSGFKLFTSFGDFENYP
jgi:hypothetical protein